VKQSFEHCLKRGLERRVEHDLERGAQTTLRTGCSKPSYEPWAETMV
jgi:hypothetical protein